MLPLFCVTTGISHRVQLAILVIFSKCSVCVYSNSRNDVPRVAQRYGTIAVRPRCVSSVLRAHAQFCRFDKADAIADVQ